MRRLLFLITEDRYFCTHRLRLGQYAKDKGFEVAIACSVENSQKEIERQGIKVYPLSSGFRASLNPIKDLKILKEIKEVINNFKPDVIHNVALKPVIYGTIIARICKVPKIINALGGLGYLFTPTSEMVKNKLFYNTKKFILGLIVRYLLKGCFSQKNVTLVLQNDGDLKTLLALNIVKPEKVKIIRGAGVDVDYYTVEPFKDSEVTISFVSRMLWDKGIAELIKAIELIKQEGIKAEFLFYGEPDLKNPASVSLEEIKNWESKGLIKYMGYEKDVAKVYANSHIAVLPSYREGMPKSLLEAASCGRAIVTTDIPGCNDVVKNDFNGILVKPKDYLSLANALKVLIKDRNLRETMGLNSRVRVMTNFTDKIISEETLQAYNQ